MLSLRSQVLLAPYWPQALPGDFHRLIELEKTGPQWIPGVWITKTDGDDLHVVATPEGLIRGKAIRRLTNPWRSVWLFMVQEKP